MLIILTIFFIITALAISGERTAKSIVTLTFNIIFLLVSLYAIHKGFNPFITLLIASILLCAISLLFQNEVNEKTITAFFSVVIILILMIFVINYLVHIGNIQGVSGMYNEYIRKSNGFSDNIKINMLLLEIGVVMITLIGAVTDAAISVVSGTYEVAKNMNNPTKRNILKSGINISRSILNSTVNTIFFIAVGEYLILFINFIKFYSFTELINSKSFAQGSATIIICTIGCIMVMPLSALISSIKFSKTLNKKSG